MEAVAAGGAALAASVATTERAGAGWRSRVLGPGKGEPAGASSQALNSSRDPPSSYSSSSSAVSGSGSVAVEEVRFRERVMYC